MSYEGIKLITTKTKKLIKNIITIIQKQKTQNKHIIIQKKKLKINTSSSKINFVKSHKISYSLIKYKSRRDGNRTERFLKTGSPESKFWKLDKDKGYKWMKTHKQQNKLVKATNGNGRKSLSIVQWNMGSKQWHRKTDEVRQLLSELNPDIFVAAEANLQEATSVEEMAIEGYKLITPLKHPNRNVSRMVVLVRDSINIQIREDIMENDCTSIWMEFQRSGKKKLYIGAIYREYTLTGIPLPNNSNDIAQQNKRWKQFLKQWSKIGARNDTLIIGDTNFDFHRWENPSQICKKMVDDTKIEVDTLGFKQLILETTRTWREQRDSILDQAWTNIPDTVLSTFVHTRGASGHCVVGVTLRIKGTEGNCLEYLCRKRSKFNLDRYRKSLSSSHWEELYALTDLNKANHWLEERLRQVLQVECPMIKIQPNKKQKSWADKETMELFAERDTMRETARRTGKDEDWTDFRRLRNLATKKDTSKNCVKNWKSQIIQRGCIKQ